MELHVREHVIKGNNKSYLIVGRHNSGKTQLTNFISKKLQTNLAVLIPSTHSNREFWSNNGIKPEYIHMHNTEALLTNINKTVDKVVSNRQITLIIDALEPESSQQFKDSLKSLVGKLNLFLTFNLSKINPFIMYSLQYLDSLTFDYIVLTPTHFLEPEYKLFLQHYVTLNPKDFDSLVQHFCDTSTNMVIDVATKNIEYKII